MPTLIEDIVDTEGLLGMFEDTGELPPVPATVPAEFPTKRNVEYQVTEDDEWKDDNTAGKFDKIRRVFMNGRTAQDVLLHAQTMSDRDWMDTVVRLAPKQIDVNTVQITSIKVELPPGYADDNVVEIELPGK